MDAMAIETGLSVFVAAGTLVVALIAWKSAMVRWAREAVFEARTELFLAAARHDLLDDEAYRQTRALLNGFLRWADTFTGTKLAYVLLHARLFGVPPMSHLPSVDESPLVGDIEVSMMRYVSVSSRFLWLSCPSGFVVMLAIWLLGQLKLGLRKIAEFLTRVGNDDDFARDARDPWQHIGSCLT